MLRLSRSCFQPVSVRQSYLPKHHRKQKRVIAHKMHERFKVADKDGDGKISRAEAVALPRIAKQFDEIDTNKDGFITKEELKAQQDKRAAQKQK